MSQHSEAKNKACCCCAKKFFAYFVVATAEVSLVFDVSRLICNVTDLLKKFFVKKSKKKQGGRVRNK